jgi:hypothetical protein
VHDPPPLTPQRLRELARIVIGSDDSDEQDWADHELAEAVLAWDAEPGEDHDDQYWRENEAQFDTAC